MVRAVIGKAPRRRELVLVRGVHGELAAVPPGTVAGCGVRGWAVVGPRHCGVERHSSAGGCKVEVRDRDLAGRARAPPAATPPPPPPPRPGGWRGGPGGAGKAGTDGRQGRGRGNAWWRRRGVAPSP